MSRRYESPEDFRLDGRNREAKTAPRNTVRYEEHDRTIRRQQSFLQQLDSVRNDRALVLREETRSRPTRTASLDRGRRTDSWALYNAELNAPRTAVVERQSLSPIPVRTRDRGFERQRPPSSPERRRERFRSREREEVYIIDNYYGKKKDPPGRDRPSLKGVQVVLGPESVGNTTVHVELDIEGDIESHLEEFSHLKRLGRFTAAEQYYKHNLYEHRNVPPVAVEYAEMLLQQGAYQRLKDLLQKQELNAPVLRPFKDLSPYGAPMRLPSPDPVENDCKIEDQRASPVPTSVEAVKGSIDDQAREFKSDAERFDLAFGLIADAAQMHAQGWLRRALSGANRAEQKFNIHREGNHRLEDSRLSSTEVSSHKATFNLGKSLQTAQVQLINSWNNINARVRSRSSLTPPELSKRASVWSDWPGLYDRLREEGRIWELRDVISSSLVAFGPTKTWANLFSLDLYAPNFLDEFLDDWGVNQAYDESTYLAILEILVDVCQSLLSLSTPLFDTDAIATVKRCLEHAARFATCIKENDRQNVKSRPYIRWILVRKGLERKLASPAQDISLNKTAFDTRYLGSFPGLTLWTSALPIYVPIRSETPAWPISEQPADSEELLQHVLKASQELGDYNTEVACLREMICRSPQPRLLFERLTHVQKFLQGDMVGYLETLLSKYLIATDQASRKSLRNELSAFDAHQPISYDIQDPLIQWCQLMVQAALYRSSGTHLAETKHIEQMAQGLLASLPIDMQEKTLHLGFGGSASIPLLSSYPGITTPARYDGLPLVPSALPPGRGVELDRLRLENELKWEVRRAYDRGFYGAAPDERSTKELEGYELEIERAKEWRRVEEERELKALREEKRQRELKLAKEEEVKRAIEKYKVEAAKEKEEEEKRYQMRLEADLQKAGFEARVIDMVRGKAPVPNPIPTWTRMARRYLSLEALNDYGLDYQLDPVRIYSMIHGSGLTEHRIRILSLSKNGFQRMSRMHCGNTRRIFGREGMPLVRATHMR
jgi:hypothetical protein